MEYMLAALVLLFNICFANWLGGLLIRTMVFPYSVHIVKQQIDGPSTVKYHDDFVKVLSTVYVILRSMVTPIGRKRDRSNMAERQTSGSQITEESEMNMIGNQEFFKKVDMKLTNLEKNSKLKCIYDLCSTYAEPNQKVMASWKVKDSDNQKSKLFKDMACSMSKILSIFNNLEINIDQNLISEPLE